MILRAAARWVLFHPRTSLLVASGAVAACWLARRPDVFAVAEPIDAIFLAVGSVGVGLLLFELNPVGEFIGFRRRGTSLLRQLGLPRLPERNGPMARSLRLSHGRTRLRWSTKLVGVTAAEIHAAAPRLYATLHADEHTVNQRRGHLGGLFAPCWEIEFSNSSHSPLAKPVSLAPEAQ